MRSSPARTLRGWPPSRPPAGPAQPLQHKDDIIATYLGYLHLDSLSGDVKRSHPKRLLVFFF